MLEKVVSEAAVFSGKISRNKKHWL